MTTVKLQLPALSVKQLWGSCILTLVFCFLFDPDPDSDPDFDFEDNPLDSTIQIEIDIGIGILQRQRIQGYIMFDFDSDPDPDSSRNIFPKTGLTGHPKGFSPRTLDPLDPRTLFLSFRQAPSLAALRLPDGSRKKLHENRVRRPVLVLSAPARYSYS